MLIDSPLSVDPAAFTARTAKSHFASRSGMPVMAPVEEFKDRPEGRVPEARLQVIGPSPDAASAWEYATPT
jgi:hypothetical protein